ncbi:MAG TPA: succinate dehydrogenase cytochrome b subunit [Thermoanaerobaculia bacterium]|nr:succinate dehydrogenase cytochrome b subunit [Thermoanaerobaculia bacterium]
MSQAPTFLGSSIGKKVVMALTGVILFGYVLGHMIGNLQVYLGPEALNHYAVVLRQIFHGWALWIVRVLMLVAVGLHIWAATALTLESRRARRVGYGEQKWKESTYASRTMRWGGVIIGLFVVFHILNLTTGTVHPGFVEGDVYHNFVAAFRNVPTSIVYMIAMIALGLHLRHGVWSMFQTLGVSHPRYIAMAKAAALLFAVIIVAGNLSFPIAVLAGFIR